MPPCAVHGSVFDTPEPDPDPDPEPPLLLVWSNRRTCRTSKARLAHGLAEPEPDPDPARRLAPEPEPEPAVVYSPVRGLNPWDSQYSDPAPEPRPLSAGLHPWKLPPPRVPKLGLSQGSSFFVVLRPLAMLFLKLFAKLARLAPLRSATMPR